MVRFALSLVSMTAVIAAMASACNGDTMHVADDASVPEAGVDGLDSWQPDVAARPDREDPDPPRPEDVPDGWVLDRTYDNSCNFWVPVTREQLPPPIKWEPCPATAVPAGSACELMAVDWVVGSPNFPGGAVDRAWLRQDGVLVLPTFRNINRVDSALIVLAEADGAVLSSIFFANLKRCSGGYISVAHENYAFKVYESGSTTGGGGMLGSLTRVAPALAIHSPQTTNQSFYATPFGAIVASPAEFTIHDWDTGAAKGVLWSRAEDDDLQAQPPVSALNATFWTSSRLYRSKINVYTREGGTRAFLDPGRVSSPGYGSLGTDGKDLVWMVGEGHTRDQYEFDSLSIMTAPFVTDPSVLIPRRLRSEEGGLLASRPFFVGCGHAVVQSVGGLRVVRIADGQSWKLGNSNADFRWLYHIGITCTHVYGAVTLGNVTRLARVRIDSLGPGTPPD